MERNTGAGRLAGFMKAMDEALIKVPENWIVQGDFEPESGYRAMQQILSQAHRPTAVFCGGDVMAMGALCAADEMGLRVPQDVSLIGYDNVRNARFFTPALTTIHQPKDSLGETAFNMLLDRIVNKREESQSIEVHPRWWSAAPWRMARSATTVVKPLLRESHRAPAATLCSAFHCLPDNPAARSAQVTYHSAARSGNRPHPGKDSPDLTRPTAPC